jgi:PH (Pleckstrin Homology) domain-containing protein
LEVTRELPIHDFDVDGIMRDELEPGERLLWSGRPGQGLRLREADWFAIPFTVGFFGFTVFFAFFDPSRHDSWPSLIVRAWLLVGGFYIAIVRIPLDAWRRANTAYGITDRRAIIRRGLFGRTKSMPLIEVPAILVTRHGSGEGDVVFDTEDMSHVAVGGAVPRGRRVPDAFEFVANPESVHAIARSAWLRAPEELAPVPVDLNGLGVIFARR